jgi:hypothetical protein
VSYQFAPRADVSDDYLRALAMVRGRTLVGNPQSQISVGLTQTLEAKWRNRSDTTATTAGAGATLGGDKLKLLSLSFNSISYDFERARATKRTGFATDQWGWRANSDLLPGFDFSMGYSLFQGDLTSDTARFKPYRTSINASFSLNSRSNLFAVFTRLFSRGVPAATPGTEKPVPTAQDVQQQQVASQPVAGTGSRYTRYDALPASGQGWNASFTFTSSRQRPVTGGNVIELLPTAQCDVAALTPLQRDQCIQYISSQQPNVGANQGFGGAPIYRVPPQSALTGNLSFDLTPKWTMQWSTSYNFIEKNFGMHVVNLQRDLHDWRAVFSFTQSPNGSSAFSVYISLKAEPDLKVDYNKTTYPSSNF